MSHQSITTSAQLAEFCQRLRQADRVGFDTEFVSEDTFRPELCLIQVATADELAVIDPYEVGDLTQFWETLADGEQVTIAHAAREEVNFSLRALDRAPQQLFDTQIAAAFCSNEYPSSFGSVVTKFLGHRVSKGEQRTDWRRRPLSDEQIDYALEDVRYLLDLHTELLQRMRHRGRLEWFQDEMTDWLQEVDDARTRQRWQKVSGIGNLSPKSLSIVRELWLWRQQEAERRDVPPRRVLRDDLLVELAKRKSDRPEKIRAIRGMQYSKQRRVIEDLSACVRRGLDAKPEPSERSRKRQTPPQLNLLGQFLAPALASICREANVATSLVGTASDVRELISYRLGCSDASNGELPGLAAGWRADLVGHLIEELLEGRRSIQITNPRSENPLEFKRVDP